MSATETLAQFIVDTEYDRLPGSVVEAAKITILDGVANLPAYITPRERSRALRQVVEAATAQEVQVITQLFEEADYSVHPISLHHYSGMYQASRLGDSGNQE